MLSRLMARSIKTVTDFDTGTEYLVEIYRGNLGMPVGGWISTEKVLLRDQLGRWHAVWCFGQLEGRYTDLNRKKRSLRDDIAAENKRVKRSAQGHVGLPRTKEARESTSAGMKRMHAQLSPEARAARGRNISEAKKKANALKRAAREAEKEACGVSGLMLFTFEKGPRWNTQMYIGFVDASSPRLHTCTTVEDLERRITSSLFKCYEAAEREGRPIVGRAAVGKDRGWTFTVRKKPPDRSIAYMMVRQAIETLGTKNISVINAPVVRGCCMH